MIQTKAFAIIALDYGTKCLKCLFSLSQDCSLFSKSLMLEASQIVVVRGAI